jgi:hypothetical protein
LRRADIVLGPLGVGGHVDHVAVASALGLLAHRNVLRPNALLLAYEDIPYVMYDRCRGWQRETSAEPFADVCATQASWAAKLDAIAQYRSQERILWIDPAPWREQLLRYAAALTPPQPAERLWRRSA